MDDVEIRVATDDDIVALAGLITELGSPTTPGEMARRMERLGHRPDSITLVAAMNGSGVVGMAGLLVTPSFARSAPDGQVIALVVAETHRGLGIGRALLARAEAWFADAGVGRVTLTSGSHRPRAHAFYRSCSYEQTGVRFVRMIG
jgi:GNAT superfamily N-acetyltransferase